jgi:cob(I)alamin adenosyltransferase
VVFGGGFPLRVGGKVIGGLGISGGAVTEDEQIARHVLAAFDAYLKKNDRTAQYASFFNS